MTKEIKFRGLRTDGKGVVYGYLVIDPQKRCRIYYQPFGASSSNTYQFVKKESVGQYTGLKDKNGVEIYSGYRVRWFGASGIEDGIGFVKWSNDKSAYVVYVDDYNEHYLYDVHYADMVVIGNIHEKEVKDGI